jgi:cell wall-associated NlpC family hydrolase
LFDYKDLLGIPFKRHGRDKNGMDCYGLVMEIQKRRGIALPEFAYGDDVEMSLIHQMVAQGKQLFEKIDRPEAFCFVVFSVLPPYETHIGVVLEDGNSFIHIMRDKSVVVSRLDAVAWRHRIRGFYRWAA